MANPRKRAPGKPPGDMGRPKKPEADRKGDLVRVRVTAEQRTMFAEAAAKAGLDLSSWLRSLGIREAQKSGGGTGA